MKQLLFLLLFPCLAVAQYTGNGNQKITLGEQTTADGLVFRGVANDTNVITPFSDTSAYIILDTANSKFYHYNRTTTYWSLAGGGGDSGGVTSFSAGTTGLTPSTATTGAVTLGGTLAVANGGTGSATKNFVDLTTSQTVAGIKQFTDVFAIKSATNDSFKIEFSPSNTSPNFELYGGRGSDAVGSSAYWRLRDFVNARSWIGQISSAGNLDFYFNYGGSFFKRHTFTKEGNVGIGVVPTSLSDAIYNNLQIGESGLIAAYNSGASVINFGQNYYNNGGWKRLVTDASSQIQLNTGTIDFRVAASGSANSAITWTQAMNIDNTGKVGIGTASPLALLNVMGTVRINSASAPDANYYLQLENSSSQKAKANAWDTYSDKRIKTDIQPIVNAIDKVNLLNPVYYQKHDSYVENDFLNIDFDSSVKSLGFIAQEVYNIIPEAVNTGTTNELWAMDYTKIIPILTKAIQEQNALIKALEQRILILENK